MDKLRQLLSLAWTGLRRLPVARWLKPVWKGLLLEAVSSGGDRLQEEVDRLLREHGEKALDQINAKVDGFQGTFAKVVAALPIPQAWRDRVRVAVDGPVDALQARLREGCATRCADRAQEVFDAAFDSFQEDLAARVRAL